MAFLKDADKIKDYEDFEASTKESDNRPFPVSEQLIDEVYTIDWEKPSYVKFADMAEDVLHDPYYNLTKQQLKSYYHKMGLNEKIIKLFTKITPLYNIYLSMLENEKLRWKWLEKKRTERRRLETIAYDFEKTTDEEICGIISRIEKELIK